MQFEELSILEKGAREGLLAAASSRGARVTGTTITIVESVIDDQSEASLHLLREIVELIRGKIIKCVEFRGNTRRFPRLYPGHNDTVAVHTSSSNQEGLQQSVEIISLTAIKRIVL